MKVAFWGGAHRCGTTSSMAAAASYAANHMDRSSICVQPKGGGTDLELFFQPGEGRSLFREESTYYALEGMDYLIWQEQHHRLDEAVIRETLVSLPGGKLSYLQSGAREKAGLYPAETGDLQRKILQQLESCTDVVFIDLGTQRGGLATSMMELADCLVVNLCGSKNELEQIFEQPFSRQKNAIYLLSNYTDDEIYNRDNLQRIYRIDRRRICNLSSNVSFAHACMHGRVDRFVQGGGRTYGINRNGHFFGQLRHLTNLIMEVGAGE